MRLNSTIFNPFKPNRTPHLFRVVFFLFKLEVKCGNPDETPHYAASGLGLHHLPTSHKKDDRRM